jgi:hypothetical protein
MKTYFLRFAHALFDTPCRECGEVRVLFWHGHCAFCDDDEGRVL